MGFKYINPGYPELFDSFDSGSLVGDSDSTKNPENGVAISFMTTASTVHIPSLKELYLKFEFYFPSLQNHRRLFKIIGDTSTIFEVRTFGGDSGIDLFYRDYTDSSADSFFRLTSGQRYSFTLAITIDSYNTAKVKICIDGETKYEGSQTTGNASISGITFSGGNSDCRNAYFANLIISGEDCSNEYVAIAPFTVDSAEGMTVDAESLDEIISRTFNYKKSITSLQVGVVAANLDSEYNAASETVDGVIIETKAPSDKDSIMFSNMAVDPISEGEWTINNLKNRKFKIDPAKT